MTAEVVGVSQPKVNGIIQNTTNGKMDKPEPSQNQSAVTKEVKKLVAEGESKYH